MNRKIALMKRRTANCPIGTTTTENTDMKIKFAVGKRVGYTTHFLADTWVADTQEGRSPWTIEGRDRMEVCRYEKAASALVALRKMRRHEGDCEGRVMKLVRISDPNDIRKNMVTWEPVVAKDTVVTPVTF